MKKILLSLTVLCSLWGHTQAQTFAVIPDVAMPGGTGLMPINVGSATLQQLPFMGGALNNFYAHCWDGGSPGIAWRRTNAGGGLINEGTLPIAGAYDIDVALYLGGDGVMYALTAFWSNTIGSSAGYYYQVFRFTTVGMSPATSPILLRVSPYSGINVDANQDIGLGVIFGTTDGIQLAVANMPATLPAFSGPCALSGTSGYAYPDVCISRNTSSTVQMTYRSTTETNIREAIIPFASALGCLSTGFATESVVTAATGMKLSVPRIDCPDALPTPKWAVVYAEYGNVGTTVTERIYANVRNGSGPFTVLVRNAVYTASASFSMQNPVIAYNPAADSIYVGWSTKNNTTAIPGTMLTKYVAQYLFNPPTGTPVTIAPTYKMISMSPTGPTDNYLPTLAFSGQNTRSNFNGLHTVFHRAGGVWYKDKPWSSATFRLAAEEAPVPAIFPNPFTDQLNLELPLEGKYQVSVYGIDGRKVYNNELDASARQRFSLPATAWAPGIYILKVRSEALQIDYTRQLVK